MTQSKLNQLEKCLVDNGVLSGGGDNQRVTSSSSIDGGITPDKERPVKVKKIGVLTFSPIVLNPGTVLQSWSLCHYLDSFTSLDVELIFYDFYKDKLLGGKSFVSVLSVLWKKYSLWRCCGFAKKIKKYPPRKPLVRENVSSINGRYDMIMVGSDQVWNHLLTKYDKTFFLDFVKGAKKGAYAPSIGKEDWPEEKKHEIKRFLKDFLFIGVREKQAVPIVQALTDKTVHWSIDPTFLINKNEWKSEALLPKEKKGSYIMEYCIMNELPLLVKVAEKATKVLGIPVIDCFGGRKRVPFAIKKHNVGADKWLGYLLNAKIVITDSFHAVAFCINNNKPFYVIISRNGNRIISILELFGLQDRLITREEDVDFTKEIDWEPVNKKLEEVRKENQDWLRNSIFKAFEDNK